MLDDRPMEFPGSILIMMANNIVLATCLTMEDSTTISNMILKKVKPLLMIFGESCQAAEPVFIPKKDAKSEDDGFVVGFVYNKTTDLSDFVVLDAQNFSDTPLARVTLPQRVPFGFHGSWINLD